mmetsp:Transcript_74714/g.188123  ORF Transcript_74714/g.188123 Transcript_74714/m.188123 type:complete len:274 (+) Transcript_74714:252-1073(+)
MCLGHGFLRVVESHVPCQSRSRNGGGEPKECHGADGIECQGGGPLQRDEPECGQWEDDEVQHRLRLREGIRPPLRRGELRASEAMYEEKQGDGSTAGRVHPDEHKKRHLVHHGEGLLGGLAYEVDQQDGKSCKPKHHRQRSHVAARRPPLFSPCDEIKGGEHAAVSEHEADQGLANPLQLPVGWHGGTNPGNAQCAEHHWPMLQDHGEQQRPSGAPRGPCDSIIHEGVAPPRLAAQLDAVVGFDLAADALRVLVAAANRISRAASSCPRKRVR